MHLYMAVLMLRATLVNFKLGSPLLLVTPSSVHATVPPVLDSVVTSASQSSRNLSPSLSHFGDHLLDQNAFLRSNGVMIEVWLEILVVSFATLLW